MANYELRQASHLACAMDNRPYRNQSMASRHMRSTNVTSVVGRTKAPSSQYMKDKLRDERASSMLTRDIYRGRDERSATGALVDHRHHQTSVNSLHQRPMKKNNFMSINNKL